jgi:prepilin-type N-terminal cleavage/methylation domain-containing protein
MITKRPFTLIELLVVIAIIAVLSAFLIPAAITLTNRSIIRATTAEMTMVRAALDEYYGDYGQYPHADVPGDGQTWGITHAELDTRYNCNLEIIEDKWVDQWFIEIHYVLRNARVMLISYGPDLTYGTDDDIEVR